MLVRKPPVSLITPVTEWPLTSGSFLPIVHNEQRFLRAAFVSNHFKYGSGEVAGAGGCLDFGQPAIRFLLKRCRGIQQCTLYNTINQDFAAYQTLGESNIEQLQTAKSYWENQTEASDAGSDDYETAQQWKFEKNFTSFNRHKLTGLGNY